jgi:NAD-dependent DNA ligase
MDFIKCPKADFKDISALSKQQAAEEIVALRESINHHDYLYYVKNKPKISDSLYDKLFHGLKQLEDTFPKLKSGDSPTVRVGAEPVGKLKKVKHQAPMLSLQATLEQNDIDAFIKTIEKKSRTKTTTYFLEPKFDGFSEEDILTLGGFARKSAKQLYQAIQDRRHPRLDHFIYALGIRLVGNRVARMLAREFQTLDTFLEAKQKTIAAFSGIGEEIATSVSNFVTKKNNRRVVQRMQTAGMEIQSMEQSTKQATKQATKKSANPGLERQNVCINRFPGALHP